MDESIPDRLMHQWLDEVRRRQLGENTGVRAIAFALSGIASRCCNAPPMLTRKLAEVCSECRRECEWRTWSAPKSASGSGDGWTTMKLRETRRINRDGEDARLAREADRFVHVAKLIEPRPLVMRVAVWRRDLLAWGSLLLCGTEGAGLERAQHAGLGSFSRWTFRAAITQARDVVLRRAIRRPYTVRAALAGDRSQAVA